jgi:hypothetical protein
MASKNKNLAELLDANGDVLLTNLDNISVDATSVSDSDNTSTGQFTLPSGTTAQRPVTSFEGAQRFNTELNVMEFYDGSIWKKISAEQTVLDSVTGTIYSGVANTLTLTGEGFLTDDIVVNFTQVSDGIDEDVTVTASSDTSATVTVPSAVYSNVSVGNAVSIKVTNADSTTSGVVTSTCKGIPTGGTRTNISGLEFLHRFNSSSTFTIPSGLTLSNAKVLIVAGGGGGGGRHGTGAGGGGVIYIQDTLTAGSYTCTVGAGGAGGDDTNTYTGNAALPTSGSNSVFGPETAVGGGKGGMYDGTYFREPSSGGSGGGATRNSASGAYPGYTTYGDGYSGTQGNPTTYSGTGYGNDGGDNTVSNNGITGGGGGAGGAAPTASSTVPGDGGVGIQIDIDGNNYYWAGGGGGQGGGDNNIRGGNGGLGGGGGGCQDDDYSASGGAVGQGGGSAINTGQDGTAASYGSSGGDGGQYSGGGGGAGGQYGFGGNGGSGIIFVRYTLPA